MFLGKPDNFIRTLSAWADSLFHDHAFFRFYWSNQAPVIKGRVYRGNHPTPKRCRDIALSGIANVVNLRGKRDCGSDALSRQAFDRLNVPYVDHPFESRNAPHRDRILRFFEFYDRSARFPLYLHCKSGADRTGLVSAMIILHEGGKIEDAKRQLSPRFLHFKFSRTGILDRFIETYEKERSDKNGKEIPFLKWVKEFYDEEGLRRFVRKKKKLFKK